MFKKRPSAKEVETNKLMADMYEIRRELSKAYAEFDSILEAELIEACVYEINALRARYSYVVRRLKEAEMADEIQPKSKKSKPQEKSL